MYKTPRLSANNGFGITEKSTVEDMDDDVAAGPELPSDQDEGDVDDEDGRFFGGGITNETAELLDYIDGRDKDDVMVSCSAF